ncbi:MAG: prepilin-type N-terminal cleavage/methylation domain-containing protein [Verrucomicrobia bacterium]|nr:prepilin-type N-terminal cleavage/methylation domain-containing protein [Verrucomicrobiota bacterium]
MDRRRLRGVRGERGFTLLEVVAVVLIVGLLLVLLLPVFGRLRARADLVKCSTNLRVLYGAVALHVQEKGSWPQIAPEADFASYSRKWVQALAPYGPTRDSWICPTIQRLLGAPDLNVEGNERIDYVPTTFDENPLRPYEFPSQPWFGEVGDVHGNGNLLILSNGSVRALKEVVRPPGSR